MADPDKQPSGPSGTRPGITVPVVVGPLVVFGSAVSYFLVFARFAPLRDFPWVNLPLVVVGLLISALGLRRAFMPGRGLVSRAFAGAGFLFSLALAGLFSAYIFVLSNQLPKTDAVVQVGQPAPDFALLDQHGETVRLSDMRGRKVVLDFYRGHW